MSHSYVYRNSPVCPTLRGLVRLCVHPPHSLAPFFPSDDATVYFSNPFLLLHPSVASACMPTLEWYLLNDISSPHGVIFGDSWWFLVILVFLGPGDSWWLLVTAAPLPYWQDFLVFSLFKATLSISQISSSSLMLRTTLHSYFFVWCTQRLLQQQKQIAASFRYCLSSSSSKSVPACTHCLLLLWCSQSNVVVVLTE